jgi:hypothetical protein
MNQTPDVAAGGGDFEDFNARQAAAVLNQATAQARHDLAPTPPALWAFRAVVALVACGSIWLSVRKQVPYTGPTAPAVAVAFIPVVINIIWSAIALRRAGTGVSGPAQRATRIWLGVMLGVWVIAYAVTAPLFHGKVGNPTWGWYPASAPFIIVGLVGAVSALALRGWLMSGICLAIGLLAVGAGFGGPAGSWLIMGIGLGAMMLVGAAFAVRGQGRSMVGS